MNKIKKRTLFGRASLAALSFVALAGLATTAFFSNSAQAQAGGGGVGAGKTSQQDFYFGPVRLVPIRPDLPLGSETIEVSLLLPAVQKVREAASRMHVIGDGFWMEIPIMGKEVPSTSRFKLWTEQNPTAPGYFLNVQIPEGQIKRMSVPTPELTIKIMGAVQSNRRYVEVESASARHQTVGTVLTAGGDPQPILIGMLVPAVQKAR